MNRALSTDRRSLLGGGIAAITLAVPAGAGAVASTVDRTEWNKAFAAFAKIEAEDAAFTPGWWETSKRCSAECEAVPHRTFPPEAYTGGRRQTTAIHHEVRKARDEIAKLDAGKMWLDPAYDDLIAHYEFKRELVKAADDRDQQVKAIRDRYDMDRLDDRAEDLGEQIVAAKRALMQMPAPDTAALRWKLDQLREDDGDMILWAPEITDQTFADIARLLPVAR